MLEEELIEITELIRPGITHDEKLNVMGIDKVIELMGYGYPLMTGHKARQPGILNIIKVPEYKFYAWLLKQPESMQNRFNNVSQIQKNRRKEELIESIQETAEEFDRLIERYEGLEELVDPTDIANILDKKVKACSNLLKQLHEIEKSERESQRDDSSSGTEEVHIHVHTSEKKLARLKQLRELKSKD